MDALPQAILQKALADLNREIDAAEARDDSEALARLARTLSYALASALIGDTNSLARILHERGGSEAN